MSGSAEPLPRPSAPGPEPARPVPPPRRSRARWLIPLFGVLIAGGLTYWALAQKNTTPPGGAPPVALKTAVVKRGDLELRIRINGQTAARNYSDVTAPKMIGNAGNRDMILLTIAASGSMVHKGDKVAEFDPQNLKDQLDDTLDTYRDRQNDVANKKVQQELDLENLRQSLRQAKATLDKALLDAKALDIRTEIDKELVQLSVEEAQAAYKELQGEVALTEVSQKADMRSTDISRILQEKYVARDRDNLARFAVYAKMDGMAVVMTYPRSMGDMVMWAVGDRVYPGTAFMKIVDQASMELQATVNQAESSQFRIGQDAVVRLDAYPGVRYTGKVYSIGALGVTPGRQQYYLRTIPIRVKIDKPDSKVLPDLTGSADVLLQKDANAVVVPASAVQYEGGKAYVQVQTPQGLVRRQVDVGITSGVQTSIRSGLDEGDVVVVN